MENPKEIQLWKPVTFDPKWLETDTSIMDDLKASWIRRREELLKGSKAYEQFMNELKREHAIETGIIERLYDLSRGVTETLIKHGIKESYISHGDANIPTDQLMGHLDDQLDAVEFVFDVIGQKRMITVGFIKELHALITRHQSHADGKDQFGKAIKIELKKGEFKKHPNNPTNKHGIRFNYCPPEQVASEMDNLVALYEIHQSEHPAILAAWFHHAFSTVHPFQDGNGRVARLLASLILIKAGYFPFTVLREDARAKYIDALEKADNGEFEGLVRYFCEGQKKQISRALQIIPDWGENLQTVTEKLAQKLSAEYQRIADENEKSTPNFHQIQYWEEIKKFLFQTQDDQVKSLKRSLKSLANFQLTKFDSKQKVPQTEKAIQEIIIRLKGSSNPDFNYSIIEVSIFHISNNTTSLCTTASIDNFSIGLVEMDSFLIHFPKGKWKDGIGFLSKAQNEFSITSIGIQPHAISILDDIEPKKKNIRKYLEDVMTIFLAKVAAEI